MMSLGNGWFPQSSFLLLFLAVLFTTASRVETTRIKHAASQQLDMFVAIMSGPVNVARRETIRQTWLQHAERQRLEREHKMLVQFVIGKSSDDAINNELQREREQHEDVLWLSQHTEDYNSMTMKLVKLLKLLLANHQPKYLVKVDDDVYLQVPRLPHALQRWQERRADYIGCFLMGNRPVQDPGHRWYEPLKDYFTTYTAYANGQLYVLSFEAMQWIVPLVDSLRVFVHDDVGLGVWMLAFNATYLDDRRLCETYCGPNSVAVLQGPCGGLCDVERDMHILHGDPKCHDAPSLLSGDSFSKWFFRKTDHQNVIVDQ